MLLETLDRKKENILIYSENKFDFENNFTFISMNEKIKFPKKISYFDVCSFIKEQTPKNMIVYRLLTNVNSLDPYSSKYSYFIYINNKMELIYFDPIFAIRDLKNLEFDLEPEDFRFKIQQVGLTSVVGKSGEVFFKETYHFDLHAIEAQNQNDKIFADAIFAFDESFDENFIEHKKETQSKNKLNWIEKNSSGTEEFKIAKLENIVEDVDSVKRDINPPKLKENMDNANLRERNIEILKSALGISPQTEPKKIPKEKTSEANQVIDLFKSTSKDNKNFIREDKNVVLKFRTID